LDQDVKLILTHEYGIKNISDFINKLLWAYVDENQPETPVEAQRIIRVNKLAQKVREEHIKQKTLLEQEISAEEEARELLKRDEEIFLKAVKREIPFPDGYIDLLPGKYESPDEFWERKAAVISSFCNFPVKPERVIQYIKDETNVLI